MSRYIFIRYIFYPARAKISNEKLLEHEALDVNRLLSILDNAGNSVNIVMLDACRDNPPTRCFRNAGRGLALISRQPPGTLISFSTCANQVAADGDGRNSPYTAALLQNIKTPGLPVEQFFKRVRNRVVENTRGKQEPAEYKMLREDFSFIPQGNVVNNVNDVPFVVTKSVAYSDTAADDRAFWTSVKDSKSPDELRAYLEQFPTGIFATLARARLKTPETGCVQSQAGNTTVPTVTGPREIRRDGRFIAYDNETVLDTSTNLMWAAKDNGSSIIRANAWGYCKNYRSSGYTDWRMPTQNELAGLYNKAQTYQSECREPSLFTSDIHSTELIRLTCTWAWAAETTSSDADCFDFDDGRRARCNQSYAHKFLRILPVRSGK